MQRVAIALAGVAVVLLAGFPLAGQSAPDAATHKQWMNDAADAQEDLREALAARDAKSVATAAVKIEGFMSRTESYWFARKAADVVKLAQTSRSQSVEVVTAAAAGKLDDAKAAFERLGATCNSCHELHPEKR